MVEVWLAQTIKEEEEIHLKVVDRVVKVVLIEIKCRHNNNSHITKVDLVQAIKAHHPCRTVEVLTEVLAVAAVVVEANRKAIKCMLEILIQESPTKCYSILLNKSISLFLRPKSSSILLVEFPKDMAL